MPEYQSSYRQSVPPLVPHQSIVPVPRPPDAPVPQPHYPSFTAPPPQRNSTLYIPINTNDSHSPPVDYSRQLADASDTANIIHWSSIKCKRVTRNVLAGELYGMAHGFDLGAVLKATISKMLQRNIPLILCTDSKSFYDCLVRLGTTLEKQLMIDVMSLRQSYERREVTEIKWIHGNNNPADSMTKSKSSTALRDLVNTNRIVLDTLEWVERTEEEAKAGLTKKGGPSN